MSHLRSAVLAIALMLTVTSPFAQAGDVTAGRTVMVKCQLCHGKNGLGTDPFRPNIAGQKQGYLVKSLMAFKTGERKSPLMSLVLESLSVEDIANVAAYYAAIKIIVEDPQ